MPGRHEPDLFKTLGRALGLPRVRLVHADTDSCTAQREQWDEGNNLLTISPGVVVAYERTATRTRRLAEHGLKVIAVPDQNSHDGEAVRGA